MEFEWDPAKREANLAKHRIDFIQASELFDGRPVWTARSTYSDEARYLTTGVIEERFVKVVWTRRNQAIHIISARRARDGERRAYHTLFG